MTKKITNRRKLTQEEEDIALSRAIEEGGNSPVVSRDEVFKILREGNGNHDASHISKRTD